MRFILAALGLVCLSQTLFADERATRVVAGNPTRVFVMAGFDVNCRPLGPIAIDVDKAPSVGRITFERDIETTVQYSLSGKCIGTRQRGVAVIYTAPAGSTGRDEFHIVGKADGSKPATRKFVVEIASN